MSVEAHRVRGTGRARAPGEAQRGFTLVEIAIALAMLAIALAALSRAAQTGIETNRALRERTLAQWVAENRVAARLSAHTWIAPGTYGGVESQAGIEFRWHEQVSESPNPALRRLDVSVAAQSEPQRELARMVGFIALEREP